LGADHTGNIQKEVDKRQERLVKEMEKKGKKSERESKLEIT
jgi:hypothetical protein